MPDLLRSALPDAKIALRPRAAVEKMAPYHPPTGGRMGKLRLDFNENTVGCSPRVVATLKRWLDEAKLTIYPEYENFPGLIAYRLNNFTSAGLEARNILVSNGTDEAIQVLVNTFVDPGDEVIALRPSYAMYKFYSELVAAEVKELAYRDDLSFPIDELLSAIGTRTKAILLANPNNPTGTGVTVEQIEQILDHAPNAAILIDEAYYEFCGVTALNLIARYPNLFVSRTFSKAYGLAGLRVGCIASQETNIRFMRKAQSPYSVNSIAVVAATAALEDYEYVRQYVLQAIEARTLIYRGLERLGIFAYPSQANFVLFRVGDRAIEIRDSLRAAGVLIRDRSYEIAGCVRVTAGTCEQARCFLNELERIW